MPMAPPPPAAAPAWQSAPPVAPQEQKKSGALVFVVVVVVALLGVGGFFAYKKFFSSAPTGPVAGTDQQQPSTAEQPGVTPAGGEQTAMGGTPVTPGYDQTAPPSAPSSQSSQPSGSQGGNWSSPAPAASSPPLVAGNPPPAQNQPLATAPPAEAPPPAAPAAEPPRRVEVFRPETPIPSETPRSSTPPPAAAHSQYSGATAGVILWSGRLDKNESFTIDGSTATSGTLTGALPGVPVMIEIDQREFALAETPSPSNGWKRLTVRSRGKRHSVVTIKWSILR